MFFSTEAVGFTNSAAAEMFACNLNGFGQHLLGETYIFIDYNEDTPSKINGSFISHIWQAKSNGVQDRGTRLLPLN